MKYWNDLVSQYGFACGSKYPEGISLYRDIYCKVLCRFAKRQKSDCRVIPYTHNSSVNLNMVKIVGSEWFEKDYLPYQKGQLWDARQFLTDDVKIDLPFPRAILTAFNSDLDEFVKVKLVISDQFDNWLEDI